VLLAAAYPPRRLVLPAFVGLVPLLVFIAERPADAPGRWSATRAGILTGLVYFGLQLYWMAVALSPYSRLAVLAYALTVVVLAGLTGLVGWAAHYLRARLRLPLALLAPLLWTTLEWTQGRLGDFAFPWLGLGHALAPYPVLAGAADLVGARGLTFWIAGVNGLLADAAVRYRAGAEPGAHAGRPPRTGPAVAAAVLLTLVPAAYGAWRAATLELRPVARVAVVQPNIGQATRMDTVLALDTSVAVLARLSLRTRADPARAVTLHAPDGAAEGVDLVAWPEVALTTELEASPGLAGSIRELSRRIDAPVLVGAYGRAPGGRLHNSAFLVDSDGIDGARYDKRRLVPFVERVPLRPASGRFGGLERGRDGVLYQVAGIATGTASRTTTPATFGVLICFEAIFPDLARDYRRGGADFLVNITNDAWFGGDTRPSRTPALWQHPAHVTMRAIENRMGIARAANTGISMFVDPVGRTRQATTLFVADVRSDTVFGTDRLTLYTRWGDWLATLAAIATLALLIVARAGGRRYSSRSGRTHPTIVEP
jgi:apolipoprotein N-acyltransferase